MLRKSEFFDDFPLNQVFLDDHFQHFRSAGVIPGAFGIDHGDGALGADPEAIGLRPIDKRFRAHEVELFQALFQEIPGFDAFFPRGTFVLGLVSAQKNMTVKFFNAEFFDQFFQFFHPTE
jgi:hypothetical protein